MIDSREEDALVVDVEDFDLLFRIRFGLEQAKKGMGRSVDEVFADLESEDWSRPRFRD